MAANNVETTARLNVDITNFKKNIQEAQRQIRLANAEFKAAAAGMDDWRKSSEGLNAKIAQTQKVLASQTTVLEELKNEYARVAAEEGESSKAAQDLAIKVLNQEAAVNKTTKDLNNYEEELEDVGKAEEMSAKNGKSVEENLKEVGDAADKAGKKAKASEGGFTVLKGALANLAAQAVTKAVEGLKNLGKAIGGATKEAAAYADDINTMSKVTGISTEKLQEMSYMADLVDVSTETIAGSMGKLTKNMASAQNGTGAAAKAFESLGISIANSDGSLRDSEEVFGDVIDALGHMENETERDAVAMNIFGKSARDLNPLIEAGSDEISKLAQEAHDMGYVMSTETLDSLNGLNDTFDRMKVVGEGVKKGFVSLAAPILNEFLTPVVDGLGKIPEAIKTGGLEGAVDVIKDTLNSLVGSVKDKLPEMLSAGSDIMTSMRLGLINALPDILNFVVEAGTSLLTKAVDEGLVIVDAIIDIIPTLVDNLVAQIPTILKAAIKMFMAIVQAIPKIVQSLTKALPQILKSIIKALSDNAPAILSGAVDMLMAIVDAIPKICKQLATDLPKIIFEVLNALAKAAPKILKAAVDAFLKIADAIPKVSKSVLKAAGDLVDGLFKALVAGLAGVGSIGVNLVKGLWQGISDMSAWIASKIKGFGQGVINGLKKFFKIESPSKVMADQVGKWLALGIGEGFDENMNAVTKDMTKDLNSAVQGLSADARVAFSGMQSGGTAAASHNNTVNNNYNFVQNNTSPKALSRLEIYRQTRNQLAFARGV